jgi:FOG: PKD repeat
MKICAFHSWWRKLISLLVLFSGFYISFGQLSVPGVPESFLIKEKAARIIPEKNLPLLNIDSLLAEDHKAGITNRYGLVQQLSVDVKNQGVPTKIANKGTIWQYKIKSENAYSLGIRFSEFHIPEGAKVFIYNESRDKIIGAFTSINNKPEKYLSVAEFKGLNAIIEYFEPKAANFSGTLKIGAVTQAYKNVYLLFPGRVGINCPQGADWQDEKHAVVSMTFQYGSYGYYCTGFLVNNIKQDGTPYIITGYHCINHTEQASTLVAYFNYEEVVCNSGVSDPYLQTLSGASIKALSLYSDLSLLLLDQLPPDSYMPYYAGWDAREDKQKGGVCIHHPDAAPKCIAIATDSLSTYPYSAKWTDGSISPPYTLWVVKFDTLPGQANRYATEAGSSGAPLFDENKRVIGQLKGGLPDVSFFGKMSLSYAYSNKPDLQLAYWLDPDETGKLWMDGAYVHVKPQANFSTPVTDVCVESTVQLQDQTKYYPTEWKWTISPPDCDFINGTDSTSQNPAIAFKKEGIYSIKLVASKKYGSDTITMSNYITVRKRIKVQLSNIPNDSIICGPCLTNYKIKAKGALHYAFSYDSLSALNYQTNADTIIMSLKPYDGKNGPFNTWVKVIGTFNSCEASDSARLKITFQTNDNIKNAITLLPGRNGPYSNQCATVEENEPHPSLSGCYYVGSDKCFSSGQAPSNTIWFTFKGPKSGKVTINTQGFNNRIAVYDAHPYTENYIFYELLAANEGSFTTNGSALIENLSVEPDKVYWLQLDGLNKETGACIIHIQSNVLEIAPNPCDGHFNLTVYTDNIGNATLQVFSLDGKLAISTSFPASQDKKTFPIDMTNLSQGLYLIKLTINSTVLKSRLMIIKP